MTIFFQISFTVSVTFHKLMQNISLHETTHVESLRKYCTHSRNLNVYATRLPTMAYRTIVDFFVESPFICKLYRYI
jgi:hypothetical protein